MSCERKSHSSNIISGGRATTGALDRTTAPRGRSKIWRCPSKDRRKFDCKIIVLCSFCRFLGSAPSMSFYFTICTSQKANNAALPLGGLLGYFPFQMRQRTPFHHSFVHPSINLVISCRSYQAKKVVISCSCPWVPRPKDILCSMRRVPFGGSDPDKGFCGSRSSARKR